MSLAISADHVELANTVRRWAERRSPISVARAALDAEVESLPPFWDEIAELGWVGLAVSEAHDGSGYGLSELAIVLEELGRNCAPGPLLTTAAVAIALDRWLTEPDPLRSLLLGATAGIGLRPDGPVWGGACADWFLVPYQAADSIVWAVLERAECEVHELASLDPTRRMASARRPPIGEVRFDRLLRCDPGDPIDLLTILASAESAGVADWCVKTAAAYAVDRVQFGRPIGQFQAVKHRCADMLVALEASKALVWDAARASDSEHDSGWRVAVAACASVVPDAAFACAKDCIQTLGGIGFTWEHDGHLYLKRAAATAHLLPAASTHRARLAGLVRSGASRSVAIELPPEAEPIRARVQAFVDELQTSPKSEWNHRVADSGYLVPHWPEPFGLDASPIEQLVIDECFAAARIRRAHLAVAAWVLPTLIAHGTVEQQQRWVGPSLRQEIMWCQMFSEPGAGSDLASLTTAATKVDGGWSITGQKVWTSMAQWAQWAICLARTDPDAPKHEGIGCFMLDMASPGIELRPLRELTGMAMFNEVFLTEVFVPDDCLVGAPTGGWEAARTTLANERVSMGNGASFGPGIVSLFELAAARDLVDDPLLTDTLGRLVATSHAVAMLGMRTTLRALGSSTGRTSPGPEASVRKLLGVTHEQEIQEVGLSMLGGDAAVSEGDGATWIAGFLGNRALSIAGGTSDIQRNVIAERLLGLPRDP